MREFKGTPGPWRQEHEVFKNGDCYRLRGSREEHLGDLYGAHREGEEAEYEANAKLIAAAPDLLAAAPDLLAAAPDLLAALQEIYRHGLQAFGEDFEVMLEAKAAIDKATSISN